MTRKKRPTSPHGPQLFAVECPACLMAVATAGDLIGSVARCPLCRAEFRVPEPNQQDGSPQQPSRPQPDGVKPDRAEASEQKESGPPTVASTPEPLATPATADTAAPVPTGPTGAVAPDSTSGNPATIPAPAEFGVAPTLVPQPGSLATPPSPAGEASMPGSLPADLFEITTEPPPAPDPELAFREPVRTIVSGDEVIELRRLTPEEKRLRQARRNMVMLLAGALVLILITVLLGRSTGR